MIPSSARLDYDIVVIGPILESQNETSLPNSIKCDISKKMFCSTMKENTIWFIDYIYSYIVSYKSATSVACV